MKREAVQEERQRTKDRDNSEVESTSSIAVDMPLERIVEAEKRVECNEVSASLEVWSFEPDLIPVISPNETVCSMKRYRPLKWLIKTRKNRLFRVHAMEIIE